MSDTSTAPAATPEAVTEAPTAALPVQQSAGLAAIKAARRAATPAAEPAQAEAPKPTETPTAPATATATIEMDPSALKQFTTLSRELRDAKAKAKDLEGKVASFGKFEKAQSLAKEGKHYDAAREAGIDVDAALAELLGNNNGAPASVGQIDKALLARLEALEAENATVKAEREERKTKDAEAAVQRDRVITDKFVADNATKYPYLAKSPKLVALAFADFETARAGLEKESGEKLSTAEQSKLLVDALAVHEEDWAKALGATTTAEALNPAEATTGVDASVRSGVTQPASKAPAKLTFEQLKAERMAKRQQARR